MVQRRQRERSLFEVLLPDGHKLWPDWLRKIDALLEDEAVIEVVAHALEARWPQSRRRGRLGTPAEVVMRAGVTHGRRFRVDTTVVETNVHYPTDSTLLQDGVRVLTRTMHRASAALGDPPAGIRNRLRSVTRRVLIIGYEARSPKTRD